MNRPVEPAGLSPAPHSSASGATRREPEFREFVALIAGLMALNALAIDSMVPALPQIGHSLGVLDENRRQLVVSFYMFGFGSTQWLYGPLSDRFGRKPVLAFSLVFYVVFALLCAAAGSFTVLLAARLLQGSAAASSRVLTVSIVRDRFEGPKMARLMSLAFMTFMLIPVLAPSFGQLTLLVASWRAIFFGLGLFAAAILVWALIRLPETLRPEYTRPILPSAILSAARETVTNRQAMGYTLGFTLMIGALMGYVMSVQQIVFDTFQRPGLIAVTFAGVAGPMAITSYLNSRLVERIGARRMAHSGIVAFTMFSLLHLGVALSGAETLLLFVLLQGLVMACFGLCSANFGAIAMQPLGHIAGTASSLQGTISTICGALLGSAIGQSFDGSTVPLAAGFSLCGALSLLVLTWAERGKLFRPG